MIRSGWRLQISNISDIPEHGVHIDVEDYALRLAEQADSLRDRARRRARDRANQDRRVYWFEPGDLVTAKRTDVFAPLLSSVRYRRLGPFTVMRRFDTVAFLADMDGVPLARSVPCDRLTLYTLDAEDAQAGEVPEVVRASSEEAGRELGTEPPEAGGVGPFAASSGGSGGGSSGVPRGPPPMDAPDQPEDDNQRDDE
ncbi:hypothetical protein IWQ57_006922, partial [Coemansia nantahalensis]